MPGAVAVTKNGAPAWKAAFTPGELRALLLAMLTAVYPKEHGAPQVELVLTNDRRMERLHKESMGCDGPTNILSFPAAPLCRSAKKSAPFLGSLALSVDTLARECFLYGQEPREHCIRLVAHGLAHIMGLDHGPDMQALCERLEAAAAETSARQGF